jgi:hypothetical protein
MRLTLTRGGLSAACVVLAVWTTSANELSRYREFELGQSLSAVTSITQTAERDLKTLHSRPALLQQVEWRPRYMTGAPVAGRDSINSIVFNFVDDRLFRMTVAYERNKTNGLTNADMIASLAAIYGAPGPSAKPRPDSAPLDAVVIAEWRQADSLITLQHSPYTTTFSLVITAVSLEATARKAQETATVLDLREAPAREAALAKKRADDERQAEERARATNKGVFQP